MKYLVMAAMIFWAGDALAQQVPGFSAGRATTASPLAGSITAARELYAAARYDASPETLPADRKAIEQYRSLCLLALGRAQEAEAAIAAVVRVDPFYRPDEAEASPRVRATFADVRQRLLPDLAAARYVEAKTAYDRKAFAEAAGRFRELVMLLEDPQMNGRLSDMRTLAAGFVDLATAAAEPPPAPKEEPAPVKPEPSPGPVEPKIYTADDAHVTPPVIIRQDVPSVPAAIASMTREKGVIDLTIDEEGRVISMTLRGRLHPVYDSALLHAARDWKYEPAQLNGRPVRYRKLLQISVKR